MNDLVIYVFLYLALLLIWGIAFYMLIHKKMLKNDMQNWMQQQMIRKDEVTGRKKETFYQKLDRQLVYSGFSIRFPWMSSELYLILNAGIVTLITVFVALLSKSLFASALTVGICFFFSKIFLEFMITSRDKKIEKELLTMLDMIGTYSSTHGDLIEIFNAESKLLHGPLRKVLQKAVSDAKSTGNMAYALDEMKRAVRYDLFQFVVDNLIVISQYNTDYEQVIDIMKETIDKKIKSNEKIKTIYAKGRTEIVMYMLVGLLSLEFTQKISNVKLIEQLTGNGIIGYILLFAYIAVNFLMLYVAFIKNNTD